MGGIKTNDRKWVDFGISGRTGGDDIRVKEEEEKAKRWRENC